MRRISTLLGVSLSCLVFVLVSGVGVVWGAPSPEPVAHPFEIVPGSFHLTPSSYQAGAHADWTLTFDLAHDAAGKTYGDLRSTLVNYPTGFMGNGNYTVFPTCTLTQLLAQQPGFAAGTLCPPASQVGTISIDVTIKERMVRITSPVYNILSTSYGVASELGFKTAIITQVLPVEVRPGDSGLTGTGPDVKELAEPHNVSLTVWGVPAAHEHDAQRGMVCEEFEAPNVVECEGGGVEAKVPALPFLANPTSCEAALPASMKAVSWEESQPEEWLTDTLVEPGLTGAVGSVGPFTECERLHFNPQIAVTPSTRNAESPSGLSVALEVPQTWNEPESFVSSNVRDVSVTLPAGYTVNPSDGNGVAGCTPEQYAAETAFSEARCPAESRIGSVSIETPLLGEAIQGSVYLAQPYDNLPAFGDAAHPGGSLLALYVVAKDPQRGVIVKTAGKVVPDPVTGQLTSTFTGLPQQPFSRVTFDLKQGVTSPLVSPPACGSYSSQAMMTPSSDPSNPRVVQGSLHIEAGVGGGACPAGGAPPFSPRVISGTQSGAAGSYSPFYLRIVREDGEQELTKFSTVLPPGLTGNLTGIPFCSDAQIQHAREATGRQELASPSCPGASEIGHTLVGAGVGSVLAWTPGKVYLAGPYHGSALSIVSVTSATVGPFDLGTVVIRFALKINPTTGQAEIDGSASDPIPHIIDGIVVHVRDIHVYVDRPKFTIDPTNCNQMTIANAITGAGADIASSADDQTVNVETPFQAADCANLAFKPSFKASTTANVSRRDGAGLTVKLAYPAGSLGTEANIRSVRVELPKQLPSRLPTLQKACPNAVFNADPASCPAASRVGVAKAITPLIPVPLTGPAYFVSYGGAQFPELVIVLQGYGITIDLHGETFIDEKTNVTSSTFKTVPDQPVGSFELSLPQGPYSALAAPSGVCGAELAMPTTFTAQNGMSFHQKTTISVSGCKPALRVLRHRVKAGVATLTVRVPAAGRLRASGAGLTSTTKRLRKAGVAAISVALSAGERRFLAKHPGRKLRARVRLRFVPAHGKALGATATVVIG